MSTEDRACIDMPDDDDNATNHLFWVALYLADLAYGGPEEGGWYFDAGTLVIDPETYRQVGYGPAGFAKSDDARAHAEAMNRQLDELNRGRPEKSSVNSVGVFEVRVFRAQTLPTHFPETTPRYE
jgi:hypothetical protein